MRAELPVLSGLMERGAWGKLESCDPPITVPAWSCMMSSKDPGTLGFYGFRNRKDHSYDGLTFATSEKVQATTACGTSSPAPASTSWRWACRRRSRRGR